MGRDAVMETARAFMTAFPDMVVRRVELRDTDGYVEFHWHWSGTNTGPMAQGIRSISEARNNGLWTKMT
ncbi:MAG: hypothetical protein WBO47_07790 [Gammaproteobacteria bacterium]